MEQLIEFVSYRLLFSLAWLGLEGSILFHTPIVPYKDNLSTFLGFLKTMNFS